MYKFKPAQIIMLGFLALILIGALLLSLPAAAREGQLSFSDALFTSTSAVCVTGLVVVDTGATFTLFGQIVILILIQAGGIGVMTVMSLVFVILGKRITLSERMVLSEALGENNLSGVVRMILNVIKYTLIFELAGAAILAIRFVPMFGAAKGIYYSIFHAVSAFCNAGFDVLGPVSGEFTSISMFSSDPIVVLTIAALLILGGLGFVVISNLFGFNHLHKNQHLSRYSRLVLIANAVLVAAGLIVVFSFELNNPRTLGSMDMGGKLLSGFFQAVTPRTAGFATIDQSALMPVTRFVVIILMFIGASPAGTGGGIKTTTLAIVAIFALSSFKRSEDVNVLGRRLAYDTMRRALSVMMLALLYVLVVCFVLIAIESDRAEPLYTTQNIVFEAVSAFGTVGLSAGLTPTLSAASRAVLIATMFIGRVGLMTLVLGISSRSLMDSRKLRYPEERFMVG